MGWNTTNQGICAQKTQGICAKKKIIAKLKSFPALALQYTLCL
jgi:hypothetical protein